MIGEQQLLRPTAEFTQGCWPKERRRSGLCAAAAAAGAGVGMKSETYTDNQVQEEVCVYDF